MTDTPEDKSAATAGHIVRETLFGSLRAAVRRGVAPSTQWKILAAASALLIAIAALEIVSRSVLALSLLYLLPISLVTWFISRTAGIAFASFAAAVALLCGLIYSPLYPVAAWWNCGMRFGILVVFVWLLAALCQHTWQQDHAVNERARELENEIAERKRAERDFFKLLQRQREQIAYDLHDGLAQLLTAIAMKTKHLERELDAEFSPHAEAANAIVKRMNEAVGQTRDIARGLSPIDGEATELVAAVRLLAAETARDYNVKCRSTSSHSQLPYSRDASVHIYRICQQAIDNALRHGGAKSIEIQLHQDDRRFRLTLQDDGCGFARPSEPLQGLGLRTMAFRAEVIGGKFRISSSRHGGTTVEVTAGLAALLSNETDPPRATSSRDSRML
ncbi:MAG: sensor histidine kinase [Chthoniobacterales bacterium]|nr:sensor histidine kinase [Chthoniobacterales bacterium]